MKHGIVKQQIIETASHLFYTNGYNLTGINEIIEKTSIAKATLYNHFKSKEDICVAYLQYKNSLFISDITNFISKKEKGRTRILAIFDFLKQFYNKKDFNGCWCVKTVAELPRHNKIIRAEIRKQKIDFLNLIKSVVKDNTTSKDIETLTKQIYLLYEGAVSESHLHNEHWPIDTARSVCEKII